MFELNKDTQDSVTDELWKPISGFEGLYEVNSFGNVRSLDRVILDNVRNCNRTLKGRSILANVGTTGYYYVSLYKNGKQTKKKNHRLVAETFIPNPENKPQVNHIDENKLNNNLENLEWVTEKENTNHGTGTLRRGLIQGKAVAQFKDGEFVNSFYSIHQAERLTGVKRAHISGVLKGKYKTAKGFEWRWLSDGAI
jgi:hypothetical protein